MSNDPHYCRMHEWAKNCLNNETGSLEYCAEVCELHRKFRDLGDTEPVIIIYDDNETE